MISTNPEGDGCKAPEGRTFHEILTEKDRMGASGCRPDLTPMAGEGMHAFAAQGSAVEGGGAIIVKNRDEHPMYQEMRYHQGHVYRYYGIYGGNEDHMSLTGGVNEAGFAVFSAVAEPIPKDVRLAYGKRGTLAALLGNCSSVKEALEMKDYFKSPGFFLMADAHEIAYVEIGEDGIWDVKTEENGTLAHTNHFLLPDLTQFNHEIGRSSSTRLHRIDELLSEPHAPYTLDDMIAFSEDEHDGPNDSIWRTGSRKDGVQTLATIGVWLHDDAKPDIYVKIRYSPDDQGKEDIYQLDGAHLFPSR